MFEILKCLNSREFVLIGGYAVNAYTLPRFSTDCDIVITYEKILEIEELLLKEGYHECEETSNFAYDGKFKRFEKELAKDFKVSIDILIDEIRDRQTGALFSAEWVFKNSKIRTLRGKTITEELNLRILNSEALFVTKMIACRKTDIRDIFLLISEIKDKDWVKKEVFIRTSFEKKLDIITKEINSKQFRDGLQGVFGSIDNTIFEKHKQAFLEF